MSGTTQLGERLRAQSEDILRDWLERFAEESHRGVSDGLRDDSHTLLATFCDELAREADKLEAQSDVLDALARSRVAAGYATEDTSLWVSNLRESLLAQLSGRDDVEPLRKVSRLLDRITHLLFSAYVSARDERIARQQDDLIEVSTPTIQIWQGIVALPLIGTLDSRRAIMVMESLLNKIAATQSGIAIIDVTGVAVVDTLVAQHLLKTVAAARLTGARCILCGIRPQIAQTMVELGIDLGDITTAANMAAAFQVALRLSGLEVAPISEA